MRKIALDKQIQIYSVDTSDFYGELESKIHRKLKRAYRFKKHLKNLLNNSTNKEYLAKLDHHYKSINKKISTYKDDLYIKFKDSKSEVRHLNPEKLNERKIISVFESVLTRTLQLKENEITTDIIVIQTFFFDVLESLIYNGFIFNNEKYICFTASAGQIRTKKTVFIKERVWLKNKSTLMCGLTIERVNESGGVNINKYLAYLALCNSATEEWKEFNIDKAIVVSDMETSVHSEVDFINDRTYEIKRQKLSMPIEHTDGCGMILPRVTKKAMMVRLPWVKGLLIPFPYDKFIREQNRKVHSSTKYGKIKDIYGKEYDLIKDGIEVIFTKSQFKMWKYYDSWDEYKDFYKLHKCHAGKCNMEEDKIDNAKLNYQMLQTLTDITEKELTKLASKTIENVKNIGSDKRTMLKVLGVTETNTSKNYLQQALELYPELLNDTYSKEVLKTVKKSMVKNARAGKLETTGKYTFISPDLYAFCEYLILNVESPKGLLSNGEVFCSLFRHDEQVDCLRSPHLYKEHAVRNNVLNKECGRWFITKSLYTSIHDPISKILMFDVDGDKSLVCNDKTLVEVAKRNMNNVVPLYYKMAKAEAQLINEGNIYSGLVAAYTGGNIGMISNDITKIWNGENVNLDVVKLLCMENNFTIDYAKTLYKPKRPSDKKRLITDFTRVKVPHFFKYAKNKEKTEAINGSAVNKLEKIIPNPRINFKAVKLGKFDYRILLNEEYIETPEDSLVVEKYQELDLNKRYMEIVPIESKPSGDNLGLYGLIRNELLKINPDSIRVTDILVNYLYKNKRSNYKTTLWSCFGDILVSNIANNLNKKLVCCTCGEKFIVHKQRQTRCDSCQHEYSLLANRMRVKKYRNNSNAEL